MTDQAASSPAEPAGGTPTPRTLGHERSRGAGPAARPAATSGGRNVPVAIAVGLVLIIYIVATLRWWNWGFIIFIAAALTIGVFELIPAFRKIGLFAPWQPVVVGTPLTILLGFWAGQRGDDVSGGLTAIVVVLALTTLATMIWRMARGVAHYVQDTAAGLFMIAYLPLLGSTIGLILADHNGSRRVASYLLCVVASDTGAYLFGSILGKHKMAPAISPGKTWEGFIGGASSAALVGAALAVWVLHAPWWVGVILGLNMAVFGSLGDLIESMIKRDVGIKDMGKILPAHGGAMDRLDSLLVAAPVAWVVMYFLVPR